MDDMDKRLNKTERSEIVRIKEDIFVLNWHKKQLRQSARKGIDKLIYVLIVQLHRVKYGYGREE